MTASAPTVQKTNGLSTVLDVITSPVKAFETLRTVPMWGWAFIISCGLAMIGQYLASPAGVHMLQTSWPAQVAANPKLAAMTPAQQQAALNMGVTGVRFAWLAMPVIILVCGLIQTVIMLIFNAAGKGSASFKHLWSAAMNVFVVAFGVYGIVNGVIAMARGPQSFNAAVDIMRSMPGLAWVAPGAPVKLIAVLAAFNIVSIWGAVLLAIAMIHVARVSKVNAAACAVVTTILAGLYFAWGAH